MSKFKTKAEWVNRLQDNMLDDWAEAVDTTTNPYYDDADSMYASEVMDIIVNWEGGIASGYVIRCLINILYGGDISEEDVKW